MGECHFFYPVSERSEVTDKKMTEHEVTAGAAPGYYHPAATKVP